jgi:hypothetical protein
VTTCPICPRKAALPVEVTLTRPSYWPGQPPIAEDFCAHHGQSECALADEYLVQAGLARAIVTPITTTNGS